MDTLSIDDCNNIPNDAVTDYLTHYRCEPNETLESICNIDCDIQSDLISKGRQQLCKSLSCKMLILEKNDLFTPPYEWSLYSDRRTGIAYLDRGYFGLVFLRRLGSEMLAVKIIKMNGLSNDDSNLINEVSNQLLAASSNISPKIYDYYKCNCYSGNYAIIIMEYLDGYLPDYKFRIHLEQIKNFIHKHPVQLLELKEKILILNKSIEQIIIQLVDNCNLNIPDLQLMINPTTFDVKIIDFGISEKILDSSKENIKAEFIRKFTFSI